MSTSKPLPTPSLKEPYPNGRTRIGVQGIRLKKFEEVVCDCITNRTVIPRYVPLPNAPSPQRLKLVKQAVAYSSWSGENINKTNDKIDERGSDTSTTSSSCANKHEDIQPPSFPFDILPSAACVRLPNDKNNFRPSYERYTLGKLSGIRALRKEWQLSSMIQCLIAMLPTNALGPLESTSSNTIAEEEENDIKKEERIKIVDFAGGTGHLALPLALMLPKCDIILVDLKATSLQLVHEKAEDLVLSNNNNNEQHGLFLPPSYKNDYDEQKEQQQQEVSPSTKDDGSEKKDKTDIDKQSKSNTNHIADHPRKKKKKKARVKPKGASRDIDVTSHANIIQQSQHIPNLYTYHGSITTYAQEHDFDIGLSLHCCGEGTDLVLRACGQAKANFIVSPCCVGKLSSQTRNPYVYHATSTNDATVSYPQSSIFRELIPEKIKFDALAKAADYSDFQDMRTTRNATRRTAKALLENDRIFMCKEIYGYDDVVLTRMDPWEASPKNDILIGWFQNANKSIMIPYDCYDSRAENIPPDDECNADIELAITQLLPPNDDCERTEHKDANDDDNEESNTDWNKDEIEAYRLIVEDFIASEERVKRFPTKMGSRLRKLVHYHAERVNLRHWSEGKKVSEKIVVIAKKKES